MTTDMGTTERELLSLEQQYWQALKDHDAQTAMRLSDDRCIVAGPTGATELDRETIGDMIKDAQWQIRAFELDQDCQVRMIGDDVAVLAYKVHEDVTVDGKRVKLDACDASTWVRRDGHWVCAMHAESIMGDPFGRDRKASAKRTRAAQH